jgi:hypothetical protein
VVSGRKLKRDQVENFDQGWGGLAGDAARRGLGFFEIYNSGAKKTITDGPGRKARTGPNMVATRADVGQAGLSHCSSQALAWPIGKATNMITKFSILWVGIGKGLSNQAVLESNIHRVLRIGSGSIL